MRNGKLLLLTTALFMIGLVFEGKAQSRGIKTNLLYWFTATPNMGIEQKLSEHYTLSASLGYNAFNFRNSSSPEEAGKNPKLHHWLAVAEAKYWFCQSFERHYLSLSAMGGKYNAGGISFISFMKNHRYEGWIMGAGVNYGYQWPLGTRWGVETSVGGGYLFMEYNQFKSRRCGVLEKHSKRHYIGPTKLSVSFIYYID